jgi:D-sedoheptulose 7-phosphate isomerase
MSLAKYTDDFTAVLRQVDPQEVQQLVTLLDEAYRKDRFVFFAGNGGSGANASHMCEDLGKGTLTDFENQKRLKVLSLTDNTPYIMAWANDTSYDRIFVEQLKNLAQPGSLLVGISGSGNSPNVLQAVEYANAHGMTTVGMTGYDGGRLGKLARHRLHVPSFNMGVVEAVHGVIFHYILDTLRERFKSA